MIFKILSNILLFFLCICSLFAQKQRDILLENEFINVPCFDPWTDRRPITEDVRHLTIDAKIMRQIYTTNANFIEFTLPLSGINNKATLQKLELYTKNSYINTSSGQKHSLPQVRVFYGNIDDVVNSRVVIVLQEDIWSILYSLPSGNYEIHSVSSEQCYLRKVPYIVQSRDPELENLMDLENYKPYKTTSGIRNAEANCLEVFVETDYAVYQSWNTNSNRVIMWVNAIMANVIALYAEENIPIVLSGIFIWDQPDPYANQSNVLTVKNAFVNHRQNNYNGRIAHLFSTRPLGGGIAHGVGGFCNTFPAYPGPFAFSSSLQDEFDDYPLYSYNVMNVAHEIGHVMGLRHTHACVWNGNQTQTDDCGNVWATANNFTPEGTNCYDEENPLLPPPSEGGTVMSFCHLVQGIGINLASGFGTQAGVVLRENFNTAACITGTNCADTPPVNNFCINPIRLTVNNVCQTRTYTNENATASGETPGFACGNQGSIIDVWFVVEIPPSGNVIIETKQVTNGLTDMVMQTYTGQCGNLTSLTCDDNSGDGNHARIQLSGRTPGEQILVRIIESGSNQSGLYGICAHDPDQPCHPDYDGLIQFYQETNGNNWTIKSGWVDGINGTNCNVCQWFGVVCNTAGRVTGLNLPNNNLTGIIGTSVLNITMLNRLNLYDNNFSGNLPYSLPQVDMLTYLDLGGNNFTGAIPVAYGNFNNIRSLYLDNNQFSGALPPFLSLLPVTTLWLDNNDFSGCIPSEYQIFCQNGVNVRLQGNPGLPFGGNYNAFCNNGNGGDADADGYCKGSNDCDDNDPTVYNGAAEICDGKDNDCNGFIDDGAPETPNIWTSNNGGNWHTATNWSLNTIPYRCHHVIINPASALSVDIAEESIAHAASLTIGTLGLLHISANADLNIEESNGASNAGQIIINGQIRIANAVETLPVAFLNTGIITVSPEGNITIVNSGHSVFVNTESGSIINNGLILLSGNHPTTGTHGLVNLGNITNTSEIRISAVTGLECSQGSTAIWTNESGSSLSVE